jgi:hypothetical protein
MDSVNVTVFDTVGEGELDSGEPDFRDDLDARQFEFEFFQGECVIRSCTEQMVLWFQELVGGALAAIVQVGEGLYDLFFPETCQAELLAMA